jgi:type III secretory pathway component EscV
LSDAAEHELAQTCVSCAGFTLLVLRRPQRGALIGALRAAVDRTSPSSLTFGRIDLRALLRRLIEDDLPDVPVLHEAELEPAVRGSETIEIPLAARASTGEVAT